MSKVFLRWNPHVCYGDLLFCPPHKEDPCPPQCTSHQWLRSPHHTPTALKHILTNAKRSLKIIRQQKNGPCVSVCSSRLNSELRSHHSYLELVGLFLVSAKQSTQSTVRLTFLGMLKSNYSSFAISSSADLFWRLLKSDEFMLSPWSVAAGMQTAFITNQRISSLRGVDELQEEFKRRFCWSAFSSLKVCSIKHWSQGF